MATTPAAVQAFYDAATAYSTAARAQIGSTLVDPSVSAQLGALPALCAAAIAALRAASSLPEVSAAVSKCEVTLAHCAELGAAVAAQLPPTMSWTVPTPMPVAAVAQRFYGAAAAQRLTEIVANNPSILGSALLPAGTVLTLAQE